MRAARPLSTLKEVILGSDEPLLHCTVDIKLHLCPGSSIAPQHLRERRHRERRLFLIRAGAALFRHELGPPAPLATSSDLALNTTGLLELRTGSRGRHLQGLSLVDLHVPLQISCSIEGSGTGRTEVTWDFEVGEDVAF